MELFALVKLAPAGLAAFKKSRRRNLLRNVDHAVRGNLGSDTTTPAGVRAWPVDQWRYIFQDDEVKQLLAGLLHSPNETCSLT